MAPKKRPDAGTILNDLSGSVFFPQESVPSLPPWLKNFQLISISQIRPGRYQKRKPDALDVETYAQLEAQMRDSHERGSLHLFVPVMPDPDDPTFYNPAQGMHRRIEIVQKLGITELPCYVSDYDQEKLALGTFYENMGRQDLTIVELGYLFQQVRGDFGLTQEECAVKLHVRGGRDHVKRCEAAADAMPDVQRLIYAAPDRSTSVVGPLSQLDVFGEEAPTKRAPIIEAFLAERITSDGVVLAVKEILNGGTFSLEEDESVKVGVSTPKTIDRLARAMRVRKTWSGYFKLIGNSPLTPAEKTELELLRQDIDTVLQSNQ